MNLTNASRKRLRGLSRTCFSSIVTCVVGVLGGSDFEVEHAGAENRETYRQMQIRVDIDQQAPQKAPNWWAAGGESATTILHTGHISTARNPMPQPVS